MSTIASAGRQPAPSRLRHRRLPIAAVAVFAAVVAVLWALPPDTFDRGMRMTFGYLAARDLAG